MRAGDQDYKTMIAIADCDASSTLQ